ncbi:MAG: hypothetical protein RID07_07225, partial [Lacipirellulaceae bacterium]
MDKNEQKNLRKLLSAAFDGSLDEEQKQQLAAQLDGNAAACDAYAEFMALEASLEQRYAKTQLDQELLDHQSEIDSQLSSRAESHDSSSESVSSHATSLAVESASREKAVGSSTGRARGHGKSSPTLRPIIAQASSRWRMLSALAASIALLAMAWSLRGEKFASVVAVEDAAWGDADSLSIGDQLGDSWIDLREGTVKLAFQDKSLVSLRGPIRFRVVSGSEGYLESGSLTAHVPPEAIGFRVACDDLSVIDLGTGFELSTDESSATRVRVLEGRVRVESNAEESAVELAAGELATYDPNEPENEKLKLSKATSLVPKTRGALSYQAEHPASLGYRDYTDDEKVNVFLERSYFSLPCEVRVNHTRPGSYTSLDVPRSVLNPGKRVHVYLIHFSPKSGRRFISGSVTFPGKILGVIGDTDMLNATNSVLGTDWTLQCRHAERGIESTPDP